jgi:predicted nucleic acid-binding protein
MDLVVDASVTACWFMPHEAHPSAEAAFERAREAVMVAPRVWWFEIRNLLIVNERRGRLASRDTSRILTAVVELPVQFDDAVEDDALITLARRHRLSAYDAAYLEVAMRRTLDLATLDGRLAEAARAEGVRLL